MKVGGPVDDAGARHSRGRKRAPDVDRVYCGNSRATGRFRPAEVPRMPVWPQVNVLAV
jgi:hypothetical protein